MNDLVLVVDDDPVVAALLTALLSRGGWTVTAVSSAQEALDYLTDGECHFIITDVNMPGMSGLELRDRIRAAPSLQHMPIVLLTATIDDAVRRVSHDEATLVLSKPVRPATFASDLRAWLSDRD